MQAKSNLLALAVALVIIAGCSALNAKPGGYLGYEHRAFKQVKHQHVTHPGDTFLHGSPGSTSVSSGDFARLGIRVTSRDTLLEKLDVYWDVGMLAGGGSDNHQNDNDSRQKGHESRVYSKVFPVAPELALGTRYFLTDNLTVGGELNWTYLNIEHGWDRFDSDQKAGSKSISLLNVGPTVGYAFDVGAVEAGFGLPLGSDNKFLFHLTFSFLGPPARVEKK